MIPGPRVQLGPLGGVALYAVAALAVVAVVGGVTTGGMVLFVAVAAVVVLATYFLVRRVIGRITGGPPA
jgi:hypothetical protein